MTASRGNPFDAKHLTSEFRRHLLYGWTTSVPTSNLLGFAFRDCGAPDLDLQRYSALSICHPLRHGQIE